MLLQHTLIDIHFMTLLEKLIHPEFSELDKLCGSKFRCKIRSLAKRS